ncbi:MAG TPA: ATP-binding protein [Candidatus Krumholzibacteria bacterium]|nr:ATP-binding protein [Candidatus Krumholzibacteria bacterium]
MNLERMLIVTAVVASLGLLGVAAVVLRENRTLRTRLAVAFVALTLVPTLLSMASLLWGQLQPRIWAAHGILSSLENTLLLARHVLHERHLLAKGAADVALVRLVQSQSPDDSLLSELLQVRYVALYCAGAPGEESVRALRGPWTPAQATALLQDVLPGKRSGMGTPQLVRAPDGVSVVVGVAGPLELHGVPHYSMVVVPVDEAEAKAMEDVRLSYQRVQQLKFRQRELMQFVYIFVALLIAFLAFALVLAFLLARSLTRPLEQLQGAFESVAAGQLGTQVHGPTRGELGRLARGFNSMSRDLQRSHEQLVGATRLAAWQDVARRLAHEIKNPLTPITLSIHRLRKRLDGEDTVVRECLDTVLEETSHLKRLADEFSSFARLPKPKLETFDASGILQQVLDLYSAVPNVQMQARLDDVPAVLADRDQIRQVFTNLVKNAVEAMPRGGLLEVHSVREGEFVDFTFLDRGSGFPAGLGQRMFEPTFTTKATGSGLGLAIVRRILEDHGGDIQTGNRDDGGAWVRIRLRAAK